MRTVTKVIALLLVLGAPVMAPQVLMQQAQAQEVNANGLTDAQQAELDAALQGSPDEVEEQLGDLLASYSNNSAVRDALIDAARDADTSDAVDRVVRTVTTAARTQQNSNNNNNNNPMSNNGAGIFTVFLNQQFLTSAVRTQQHWTNFTILNYTSLMQTNPDSIFAPFYQRRIDQLNAQLARYGQVSASACIGGQGVSVGPYGTVTSSPC